ncbi:FAD-dependent monooxygenase [Streptomyces sp. 7N604]|uniref:FAD-dependent monooxygenase n=1 Tax=Streptomyces sp. 7N604 TaxID=3457415 RepID=UPI003FCFFDE1
MVNSLDPLDVLVVGGGPTGLALAAQLERYGVRFRVVDRQPDRVHESRALAVQPRTLEVLAGVGGVAEEMVERGNRAVRLQMHVGERAVPVRLFDIGVEDTAYPYLLFLSQAETERILGDHLGGRGVRVERGTELLDFDADLDAARDSGLAPDAPGDAVICTLRHGDGSEETVAARYVVGCDGAHSRVRQAAGIPFEGRAYPQTFVLADLEADGIEPGWAHAFLSPRGLLLFFPLEAPATWRLLAMRPACDTTPVERPVELAEVQRLADAYTGASVRLRDPVWMTNFRLHNRGARDYRAGRVFLAGDAAHIHSPAGAQGMNTGIQDAVNLGWKLGLVSAGRARPELLDTYEPERAPVGRNVLRFTDRAFTIGTSTHPLVRFARTQVAPRLMPLALRIRAGRAYGLRTVTQLRIHYRSSPVSQDGPGAPRRGPRAGDRLPDAPVSADGRPTTLHRELAAPGHHLLLCGRARAFAHDHADADALADVWPAGHGPSALTGHLLSPDPTPGGLHDLDGLALRRLGLSADRTGHYLIRPDGHIGYRAGGTDLSGLRDYLSAWRLT